MENDPSPTLQRFFSDLRTQIDHIRESRRYRSLHIADELNLIDLVRPDEYRLSELIALLLNPAGAHGQGGAFLAAFLKRTPELRVSRLMTERLNEVAVRQEDMTFGRRRIDIVVSVGNELAVGIENKPWAADGHAQLHDYVDHLKSSYRDGWGIVYLSGDGTAPSEDSLPACLRRELLHQGVYVEWSYRGALARYLDECKSLCEADKVRWLLRDFRSYIANYFKLDAGTDNNVG